MNTVRIIPTTDYEDKLVREFLNACYEVHSNGRVKPHPMFAKFQAWLQSNIVMSKGAFYRALSRRYIFRHAGYLLGIKEKE